MSSEVPTAATGLERIAEAFARAHANGRSAALMPYLMGGFPDLETSREIGLAYVRGGADLIELGVPFSDPLADGPVVHAAATAALSAGSTLPAMLAIGEEIAPHIPVVVMCYANPIFARGLERFLDSLVAIGASGLIVPDLPHEESRDCAAACRQRGLALVPLVAPTTPDARLAEIGADAQGFIYAVSFTGTTGERATSLEGTEAIGRIVRRTAERTDVPVAVGFGIGTPEQAAGAASAGADGVIIGTRLVRAAAEAGGPAEAVEAVEALVRSFAAALSHVSPS